MPTHRTRAQQRIEALETPSVSQLMEQVGSLEAERDAALQEAADNLAVAQRAAADFQNYRRRTEQEREASVGLANEALLRKVIAIADDFDRAIEAMPEPLAADGWVQGIAAIDRKLRTLLDSEGVVPIEALGLPFDPHLHEALQQVETTEVPDETVILEIQRGYRIRDRVLRPSLVAVARNPGEAAAAPGSAPQGGSRSPGSLPSHTDHPTDTDPGPAAGHDQPGADAGSGGND